MFNLYSGVKDSVCRFISAVTKLNFESFWKTLLFLCSSF